MSEFERGYNMGVEDGHRCERRHAQLDQLEKDVQQLREQNRVLRNALQEIYEGRWTPGVSCCYEDDARDIYPTREMRIRNIAMAALTATSQPGGEG